jgi:hypothetical protein
LRCLRQLDCGEDAEVDTAAVRVELVIWFVFAIWVFVLIRFVPAHLWGTREVLTGDVLRERAARTCRERNGEIGRRERETETERERERQRERHRQSDVET